MHCEVLGAFGGRGDHGEDGEGDSLGLRVLRGEEGLEDVCVLLEAEEVRGDDVVDPLFALLRDDCEPLGLSKKSKEAFLSNNLNDREE